MFYFLAGLMSIFLGGLISLLFDEKHKARVFSVFSFIGTVLVSIPAIRVLLTNTQLKSVFYLPEPIGNIPVVIDPLSAFFILVIAIMSFLGVIYGSGYLESYLDKNKNIASHFLFFAILICSMLTVVCVQNALFFLIIWEIMSLSSFFLVIFESNKKEVLSAGINYLVYMHISVIFIILGFILLTLKTGSLEFSSFKAVLEANTLFCDIIFCILFIGFGTKAGFVPFHNWLPRAHPAAVSHISGIMSGVMIKTGIYGILRVLTFSGEPSLFMASFVLIISAITALYGIIYATAQKDIKKLLAYSSVENIGIIGIAIGVAMLGLCWHNTTVALLGFSGAVLHILNHSIFKEILFFSAGSVYKQTHSKNMEELGGLYKKMPHSASLFLTGSLAISALPPFNGFISEFLIYMGLLKGFVIKDIYTTVLLALAIASLAFAGAVALLCFTKVFSVTFLGAARSEKVKENVKGDVSKLMLFPVFILAIFVLLIGLFPQVFLNLFLNTVNYLASVNAPVENYVSIKMLKQISLLSFSFIIFLLACFGIRYLLSSLKKTKIAVQNTWGCGYDHINSKMQYSASSYVSPFLSTLKPLLIRHFDIKKPKELFPKSAHFDLNIEDIEEFYVVKPLVRADEKFLSKFQWIQGGYTRQYILYCLIFLVFALIGTVFIK